MKTINFDVPEYGWYNNGQGIDKAIVDIVNKYNALKNSNEKLLKENKELKSEHYKDEELKRLQEKNKELEKSLIRGFSISEKEQEQINIWMKEHKCLNNNHLKGISSYRFDIIPCIGHNGYVKCTCGEEFCFYKE